MCRGNGSMYVLGVDAGGTKTRCVIADEKETIIGESLAGACQHQIYGMEQTRQNLQMAVDQALKDAGITLADIANAVLGMSGADEPEDYEELTPVVSNILKDVPFEIVHDAWIGMSAALSPEQLFGVASICGTGAGHVGLNAQGERLSLRNLEYIRGNYGGGGELVKQALHYAFRSEEGTYTRSRLQEEVPTVFDMHSMEEVSRFLRGHELTAEQRYQLPILVFRLAEEGDLVALELLAGMGREEGRYAAAVIRRLHMETEPVPVVLIGSLFGTRSPHIIDPFMEEVHAAAPNAYPVYLTQQPVMGAARMALQKQKQTR